MTLRLRWTPSENGEPLVFPLRGGKLALAFDSAFATLTRISESLGEHEGVTAEDGANDGRVLLRSNGGVRFRKGDKDSIMVRLPVGSSITVLFSDCEGELSLEGTAPIQDKLLGSELGGYRLLGRLGQGAVGTVYRALQINLNREIALKVLNAEACQSPLAVASFKREAQAAGRLQHPNMVQVYDVGESDGRHYYAMEIVANGSLEEALLSQGPIPWEEALMMVQDAAEALAFAASHGLVHRDVKPDNLMMTPTGVVKLADLGLASTRKMLDKESAGGTPHFMAPESLQGSPDHRADIYSLGCTLFRLLTADVPFPGDDVRSILLGHRDDAIPTLKASGMIAPEGVQALLDSMMAKDPNDRPQQASEVVEQIAELLDVGHASASKKWLALVVVALLAGVWFVQQSDEEALPVEPDLVETPSSVDSVASPASSEWLREKEQLERKLALRDAQGQADSSSKVLALQEFISLYPTNPLAEEARASLAQARQEQASSASSGLEAKNAELLQAAQDAQASYAPMIEAGKWARALHKIDAIQGVDDSLVSAWRAETLAQAESLLSQLETDFDIALKEQNWQKAERLRLLFHSAVSPIPAGQRAWLTRLQALEASVRIAEQKVVLTEFRADAEKLSATLRGRVLPHLQQLKLGEALQELGRLQAELQPGSLQSSLDPLALLLESAAIAELAMRQRFDHGPFVLVEPIQNKKAEIVAFLPDGVRLAVRERGRQVERVDPWHIWMTAFAFPAFLKESAQDRCTQQQFDAFCFVVAELDLYFKIQPWAGQPSLNSLNSSAEATKEWLGVLPQTLSPQDSDLASTFVLEELFHFATAAIDSDDYLAWQHLQNILSRPSLFSLLVGPDDRTWGLRP
ncbi:MAG: protein kinase [Planctomycetes bacterium]|jgi:serine/threonine protein kinase|nr:protein kinase [Planctomycetota bacterium]MBT7319550.1 protein kinase [Planctomycetota bacterium]